MTRKKVIILSVLMLVVIGVCIGSYIYKSDFQQDRQNKVQEQSSNKSKKTTKQESSNSKNKSDEQETGDEDDSKEKTTNGEKKTNTSKEVNETKKTQQPSTSSNTSTKTQEKSTSQSKPQVEESVPAEFVETNTPPVIVETPKTAWEQLGISEYEYYNTPMTDGDEVAFKDSIERCEAEVERLKQQYFKQGLSHGNSYDILGKYTHSYIGCGINVSIYGKQYSYQQAVAMGFK